MNDRFIKRLLQGMRTDDYVSNSVGIYRKEYDKYIDLIKLCLINTNDISQFDYRIFCDYSLDDFIKSYYDFVIFKQDFEIVSKISASKIENKILSILSDDDDREKLFSILDLENRDRYYFPKIDYRKGTMKIDFDIDNLIDLLKIGEINIDKKRFSIFVNILLATIFRYLNITKIVFRDRNIINVSEILFRNSVRFIEVYDTVYLFNVYDDREKTIGFDLIYKYRIKNNTIESSRAIDVYKDKVIDKKEFFKLIQHNEYRKSIFYFKDRTNVIEYYKYFKYCYLFISVVNNCEKFLYDKIERTLRNLFHYIETKTDYKDENVFLDYYLSIFNSDDVNMLYVIKEIDKSYPDDPITNLYLRQQHDREIRIMLYEYEKMRNLHEYCEKVCELIDNHFSFKEIDEYKEGLLTRTYVSEVPFYKDFHRVKEMIYVYYNKCFYRFDEEYLKGYNDIRKNNRDLKEFDKIIEYDDGFENYRYMFFKFSDKNRTIYDIVKRLDKEYDEIHSKIAENQEAYLKLKNVDNANLLSNEDYTEYIKMFSDAENTIFNDFCKSLFEEIKKKEREKDNEIDEKEKQYIETQIERLTLFYKQLQSFTDSSLRNSTTISRKISTYIVNNINKIPILPLFIIANEKGEYKTDFYLKKNSKIVMDDNDPLLDDEIKERLIKYHKKGLTKIYNKFVEKDEEIENKFEEELKEIDSRFDC